MNEDADTTTPETVHSAELLAQVEAMLACFPDGVLLYDSEGRIIRSNAAADAILGYTREEQDAPAAERLARYEWLAEDGARVPLEDLPAMRAARYGETHRGVVVRMRSEQRDRWLSVSAAPLTVSGQRAGAVVMLSDITERKRAEQVSARDHELLARLFERVPVMITTYSPELGEFRLNGAFTRTLGWTEEDAASGDLMALVFPDPAVREEAAEFMTSLAPGWREFPDTAKNGSVVPTAWANLRLSDDTQVGIGLDLRDRKRSEEALRSVEQRFRAVIHDLPTGLIVADMSTRELHWNREAFAIHGYTGEGDVHKTVENLIADHDLRMLDGGPLPVDRWPLPRLMAGETFRDYEVLVRNVRLGWERIFSYSAVVIPAHGRMGATGLLAIRDVTIRMRAEQRMRESQEALRRSEEEARAQASQLEVILGCVADGLIVYDRHGRTIRSTPSADEILGIPVSARDLPVQDRVMGQYEVVGEHGGRLSMDEMPAVRAAVHGEEIRGAVLRLRGGYEEPRWVRMNAIPFAVDGRHAGAVLSMTDITKRKQAEEALREANERLLEADRRKDEFLGMLSHELRNPLAPIRNSLYILDHAALTGEQARRAKDVANRQVGHLTRLVDDLLDVTRIARGKIELRRADLDLAALARRTAEDYRALMHDRRLEFAVEVPQEPVLVNGDDTRLAQVLGNLLSNAAKFTPAGGRVTLAIAAQGGRAVVHVRDTGPGIAREVMPTLFEPFTQAKQTLARSEGGLGLGLALVKGLVSLHGGDVTVVDGAIGCGADFEVTLPLARAGAGAAHAAPDRSGHPAPRRRVLVVDDNTDAARSLAELVELLGHEPQVAFDGPSALKVAQETAPDIVLCDIGLPGMTGYEVAKALRASGPQGVRLIAVSGYAQPEDVAKAAAAGFDAHVAKPPDLEQIERLLR